MELVYLWVEEYKNIKKEGFNFSPRFKCHYDENTKKLTIDENKDYVSIFPENINVTAIVGENGSGKSSLLGVMYELGLNIYYIYFDNDTFYSNYLKIKSTNRYKIKKNIMEFDTIFMNRNFFMELPKLGIFKVLSLYNTNLYLKYFSVEEPPCRINQDSFHKKVLNLILSNFNLPNIFFNPKKIEIKFNNYHKDYIGYIGNIGKVHNSAYNYVYKVYLKSLEIVQSTKNIERGDDKKAKQKKLMNDFLKDKDNIINFDIQESEDDSLIFDKEKRIYKLLEKFKYIDTEILLIRKIYSFTEFNDLEILKKDANEIFFHLVKIGFLEYDFLDDDKRFSALSTGEKNMFSDFILLNNKLKVSTFQNIFILLDEPDTTLHPEWQKKYVSEILKLLKQYSHIYFHLIITSHSPFILSDLPKENVIFLEKGKQVYPFEDEKQTFGANIHTLLSHGFFMKDGLMGEFAKSKINEIIEFHNRTKADNMDKKALVSEYENQKIQFWHIQNIVGDDYLKQVIKNHLIEIEKILLGKDGAKSEEITRARAYLKSLEND